MNYQPQPQQRLQLSRLSTYLYSQIKSKTVWTVPEQELVTNLIEKNNKPVAIVRPMPREKSESNAQAIESENSSLNNVTPNSQATESAHSASNYFTPWEYNNDDEDQDLNRIAYYHHPLYYRPSHFSS